MEQLEGIIDKENNPFVCEEWKKQNHKLTSHRKNQLKALIGYTESEIRTLPNNEGAYVAFVAIRWGYAKMENHVLVSTGI
jgi:hypothetical protein